MLANAVRDMDLLFPEHTIPSSFFSAIHINLSLSNKMSADGARFKT
jgi:hypothetical protein